MKTIYSATENHECLQEEFRDSLKPTKVLATFCIVSDTKINTLRTVVPYMRHRNMKFNTCEQIAITFLSLA